MSSRPTHIHILGICGTFMGSLAQLAKASGLVVSGCDTGVYPPMSTQLEEAGIDLIQGFDPEQISLKPDLFIIGNAISRGNPLLEAILDRGLPYTSGPQWFADYVLRSKWVLAVAGTHGKTTTASMLAWILEYAGFEPGFLIGGVPQNFGVSARIGQSDFFVVEADEYDTAFFDKRSKFVHYRPNTLVINNLEFDHADIFPDLAAIETQFHHVIRTVPSCGCIIAPQANAALDRVIKRGVWSDIQYSGTDASEDWSYQILDETQNRISVQFRGDNVGEIRWSLSGEHNVANALNAIAAARSVGVDPEISAQALCEFKTVKRRMELVGRVDNYLVYDDFAHHPTAVATTLKGARARSADAKIIVAIEPRSNTMRMGVHKDRLRESVKDADAVYWFQADDLEWSLQDYVDRDDGSSIVFDDVERLRDALVDQLPASALIIVMSNGGFSGMPTKILDALKKRA